MDKKVIGLSPTMKGRRNFDHPLLDDVDQYKIKSEDSEEVLSYYTVGDTELGDEIILGYLWLAKDVVSRFRYHFPQTIPMTDDLASVAIETLTEFVREADFLPGEFFNKAQQRMVNRVADYVNNNRSICSASRSTNLRRSACNEPLEYHFSRPLTENNVGTEDPNPCYVDILDSIETLRDTDKEHMHSLITMFLKEDHDIDEGSLSEAEQEAVARLAEIGKNL